MVHLAYFEERGIETGYAWLHVVRKARAEAVHHIGLAGKVLKGNSHALFQGPYPFDDLYTAYQQTYHIIVHGIYLPAQFFQFHKG